MDAYDNAKARRRGGLLKRAAVLTQRWPLRTIGGLVLTFLLLSLVVIASLRGPSASSTTTRSQPTLITLDNSQHVDASEGQDDVSVGEAKGSVKESTSTEVEGHLRESREEVQAHEGNDAKDASGDAEYEGRVAESGDAQVGQEGTQQDKVREEEESQKDKLRRQMLEREHEEELIDKQPHSDELDVKLKSKEGAAGSRLVDPLEGIDDDLHNLSEGKEEGQEGGIQPTVNVENKEHEEEEKREPLRGLAHKEESATEETAREDLRATGRLERERLKGRGFEAERLARRVGLLERMEIERRRRMRIREAQEIHLRRAGGQLHPKRFMRPGLDLGDGGTVERMRSDDGLAEGAKEDAVSGGGDSNGGRAAGEGDHEQQQAEGGDDSGQIELVSDQQQQQQEQQQQQQQQQQHKTDQKEEKQSNDPSADGSTSAAAASADGGSSNSAVWQQRQGQVVEAFRHAWNGYKAFAFGRDELKPVSRRGEDGLGGLGATIVDTLDTAMVMQLEDVVDEAAQWVAGELPGKIAAAGQVNLFETTIRVVGGLLSAYHLSSTPPEAWGGKPQQHSADGAPPRHPDPDTFLHIAQDLGDCLRSAFTMSGSAVPLSDVVLYSKTAHRAGTGNGASSTAECTTLQMEFWELSRLTGDKDFENKAMGVMWHINKLPKEDGLVPIFIDPNSGHFSGNEIRLGSRGDSYYEYLIKAWLQQGRSPPYLRRMFDEAMTGVRKWLVAESKPRGLTFVAERPSGVRGHLHPKMDHLVCFLPGALALAATGGVTEKRAQQIGLLTQSARYYLQLARNLTRTCYEMYDVTATRLAPEIAYFNLQGDGEARDGTRADAEFSLDIQIHGLDRHNLLRPETVEALFYMHRVTGEPQYREWGWEMFQAFERYTRVDSGGYTSLDDVTSIPPPRRDKMETFFLGETLKYFFLLFGEDSLLPLDSYVFNTEAHPLPIPSKLRKQQGRRGRKELVQA